MEIHQLNYDLEGFRSLNFRALMTPETALKALCPAATEEVTQKCILLPIESEACRSLDHGEFLGILFNILRENEWKHAMRPQKDTLPSDSMSVRGGVLASTYSQRI